MVLAGFLGIESVPDGLAQGFLAFVNPDREGIIAAAGLNRPISGKPVRQKSLSAAEG